jgi:hypothetical protein
MSDLTHQDRIIRKAFIDEAAAEQGSYLAAISTGAARFRAHRARLSPAVTESGAPKPKLSKRNRRIAKAVTESLTADLAPKPAPAASSASSASSATSAPGTLAHELDADQLAAATTQAFSDRQSPFWRPTHETTPDEPVTESQNAPDKPLHLLDSDALAEHAAGAFGAYGRAQAFRSPGWRH